MSCTYGQSLNYAYECRAETLQDTDINCRTLIFLEDVFRTPWKIRNCYDLENPLSQLE